MRGARPTSGRRDQDYRSADRQSQAHAAALGREEGLEYLPGDRRVEPGPGVRYCNRYLAGRIHRCANTQPAREAIRTAHHLDGVANQVDQQLLNLRAVGVHIGGTGAQLRLERDGLAADLEAHELEGLGNDEVHV